MTDEEKFKNDFYAMNVMLVSSINSGLSKILELEKRNDFEYMKECKRTGIKYHCKFHMIDAEVDQIKKLLRFLNGIYDNIGKFNLASDAQCLKFSIDNCCFDHCFFKKSAE